jgi:hypothetical protein
MEQWIKVGAALVIVGNVLLMLSWWGLSCKIERIRQLPTKRGWLKRSDLGLDEYKGPEHVWIP